VKIFGGEIGRRREVLKPLKIQTFKENMSIREFMA
jgi:hypothetical protein